MNAIILALTALLAAATARAQNSAPAKQASALSDALISALAEADIRISRATAMLEEAEKDFTRRRKGVADPKAACLSDFDTDAFMRDWSAGRYAGVKAEAIDPAYPGLEDYCLFKALKTGSADECAPLRIFFRKDMLDGKPGTLDLSCRKKAHELLLSRAAVQGAPDFAAYCRTYYAKYAKDHMPEAAVPTVCQIILETRGDSKAMCKRIAPYLKSPLPISKICQYIAAQYASDARACLAGDEADTRKLCLTTAAYYKALHAKDAAACRKDIWCRYMLGGADAAVARQEAARLAAAPLCGLPELVAQYAPMNIRKDLADRGAAIVSLLDDARARLAAAEAAAAPDIRVAQAIDARLERAARVQDRYNRITRSLSVR